MKKKSRKPYWEMNLEELREATREFDAEFVPARKLTPSMKAQLARAKRKRPGRPVVGKGASRILVSVERGLLSRTDAYARKHGVSRSQLIARGLERILSAA